MENNINNEQNNNQETPDVELTEGFYEWVNERTHRLEVIMGIGNICMNLGFLTDAIVSLTDEVREVKDELQEVRQIKRKLAAIDKTLNKPISEERGFDAALRIEGDRIYNTPCV